MRGVTDNPVNALVAISFLLTRLMRGVTLVLLVSFPTYLFLLTRLMRGVTGMDDVSLEEFLISTHTPHARRDQINSKKQQV